MIRLVEMDWVLFTPNRITRYHCLIEEDFVDTEEDFHEPETMEINEEDVLLLMKQIEGLSRATAIWALRENDWDLMDAILMLTGV